MMIMVPASVSAQWYLDVSIGSGDVTAYRGAQAEFSWDIENEGSASIDITEFTANVDWQPQSTIQVFQGTATIAPGSYRMFYLNLSVPQQATFGQHMLWMNITGQEVGETSPSILKSWEAFEVAEIFALGLSCTANPNRLGALEGVSFTSTVTGGVEPYHYSWVFGDGSTSDHEAPIHSYSWPGTYTITLTVTDSSPTPQVQTQTLTVHVTMGIFLWSVVGGIIVVAVAIIVVVLLVMRGASRRQNQNKSPPPPVG
jgi:hypothetical protein